jgi:hypothetical protein
VKSKSNRNSSRAAKQWVSATTKATAGGILPEFSKFYSHPGKAGGTPVILDCCTYKIEEALSLLVSSQMGGTALGQDAAESSEQQASDRHGHRNDLPWGILGYHGEKFI